MNTLTVKQATQYILSLSAEDCDRIALENGSMSIRVVAETAPANMTRGRTIDGWTLFWIPVCKEPMTWQMLLGADSTRTHALATKGRIQRLVNDYGTDAETARRYTEAARGIQYGSTDTVITIVLEAMTYRQEWERFPGPSIAIRFWLNAHPKYKDVNHGKLVSANKIIKTLWGLPEVTSSGVHTLKAYNDRHNHQVIIPQITTNTLAAAWS